MAPLKVGDLTLRNRVVMASLTRNRSVPDTVPNKYNVEYYTQRAEGGAGLILSEGTLVSPQGSVWPYAPGIWNEEHVAGWRKVTDSVHAAGSLIFCQLWHVGRAAHTEMEQQKKAGKPVPGPSAIAARGGKFRQLPGEPGYVTPTPIQDPWSIVQEFRHAAKMAKKAGFDGVELHSANGYLIHQFLDYNSNQRTDEWGGSIENRCRFGLECLKALIEVWGPGRVGVKLTPCGGFNDVGMPLPDTIATYIYYISKISSFKPAYIQLMRYASNMDQTILSKDSKSYKRSVPHDVLAIYGPLIKPPPAVLRDHSEEAIRGSAMPKAPYDTQNPTPTRLFLNGGVLPSEADKLIEEGSIDGVAFGVLWICNPDLQHRLANGLDVGHGVNVDADPTTFYAFPEDDITKGYTDYPSFAHLKL
ncbi:hypothetical protein NM688_g4462 [Phlebia brevispora]|uniref:Uncharacterized protein n=1 Tax=Phlebia brevispora TaxID=194682 RepID=A0ACC1T2V6_9APHY|nr:hypothetical protein NM688_g4462 [Phlebia brevispora]